MLLHIGLISYASHPTPQNMILVLAMEAWAIDNTVIIAV